MFRLLFTTAFVVTAMLGARVPAQAPHPHAGPAGAPQTVIVSNDNRQRAGSLADGTLTLELRAQPGVWRPEGDGGRALLVAAFADGTSPPSVPAPLIRVPEGTTIVATIRNELERVLSVHGLCDRGQASCPPVDVPAGGICELRFSSGPAGTYHYWATTDRVPLAFRGPEDTQLSGAFIIDPKDAAPDDDRVFVVTEWADVTRDQLKQILTQDDPGAAFMKLRPDVLFTINGLSWPHTERLAYRVGDRVRWRIVNLSSQVHPMHLHGFHYEVDSVGDGTRDERLWGRTTAYSRHAARAAGHDDEHGVDAGAGRQLAVPLPRDAPRVAGTSHRWLAKGTDGTRRPPCGGGDDRHGARHQGCPGVRG